MSEDFFEGKNTLTGKKRFWKATNDLVGEEFFNDFIEAQIYEAIGEWRTSCRQYAYGAAGGDGERRLIMHMVSDQIDYHNDEEGDSPVMIDLEKFLLDEMEDAEMTYGDVGLWERLADKISERAREVRAEIDRA